MANRDLFSGRFFRHPRPDRGSPSEPCRGWPVAAGHDDGECARPSTTVQETLHSLARLLHFDLLLMETLHSVARLLQSRGSPIGSGMTGRVVTVFFSSWPAATGHPPTVMETLHSLARLLQFTALFEGGAPFCGTPPAPTSPSIGCEDDVRDPRCLQLDF